MHHVQAPKKEKTTGTRTEKHIFKIVKMLILFSNIHKQKSDMHGMNYEVT